MPFTFSEYMLCAARPDFHTFPCQVIISFSPRDPVLGSEGSIQSSHLRKGASLGALTAAWPGKGQGWPGAGIQAALDLGTSFPVTFCLLSLMDSHGWAQRSSPVSSRTSPSRGLKAGTGSMPASPDQCSVHILASVPLSKTCPAGPISDDAIILTQVG